LKLIVQDNPRDWQNVNRIGDLYAKLNKLKEANDQYVKVARYYADDGFFLKAIAVWKKVLRNDPSMLEGSRELGDLYARQGLVAEARQTLGQVYDEYVKKNRMREAEEVLRRLSELDPSDFKVKGLLADLYTRQGDQEKAAGEYIAIADELLKKGKPAEALQLIDKSLRSGPRFPKLLSVAANVHIVQKDYPRAIELLEELARVRGSPSPTSARGAPRTRARCSRRSCSATRATRTRGCSSGRSTSPTVASTTRSTTSSPWSTSSRRGARSSAGPRCCSRSCSATRSTPRPSPSWSSSTAW